MRIHSILHPSRNESEIPPDDCFPFQPRKEVTCGVSELSTEFGSRSKSLKLAESVQNVQRMCRECAENVQNVPQNLGPGVLLVSWVSRLQSFPFPKIISSTTPGQGESSLLTELPPTLQASASVANGVLQIAGEIGVA